MTQSLKQFWVVQSATGSGKSLLFPLMSGSWNYRYTFVTQPGKIHVENIIKMLNQIAGYQVAYPMFQLQQQKGGIFVCTPTELMKKLARNYISIDESRFILDEFHERKVEQDVVFAQLMSNLNMLSHPGHIVLMSATPDASIVQKLKLAGDIHEFKTDGSRPHPVKIITKTVDSIRQIHESEAISIYQQVLTDMATKVIPNTGNVMCFTSGKQEAEQILRGIQRKQGKLLHILDPAQLRKFTKVQEVYKMLANLISNDKLLVVPVLLAGKALEVEKQFSINPLPDNLKAKCIKAIVSTNIAETSITIDDLVVLIDTGLFKENVYDEEKDISKLTEKRISESSRQQRVGRVGRVCPGIAYQIDLENGKKYVGLPEIQRIDLSLKILNLKSNKIDIELINQLMPSPIDRNVLNSKIQMLCRVQLLNDQLEITEKGKDVCLYDNLNIAQAIVLDDYKSNFDAVELTVALITQILVNCDLQFINNIVTGYVSNFYCKESDLVTLFQCFVDIIKNYQQLDKDQIKQFNQTNEISHKSINIIVSQIHQILINIQVIPKDAEIKQTQEYILTYVENLTQAQILQYMDNYILNLVKTYNLMKYCSGDKYMCAFDYISKVNKRPRQIYKLTQYQPQGNTESNITCFERFGTTVPFAFSKAYFGNISYNETLDMYIGKYIHRTPPSPTQQQVPVIYDIKLQNPNAFDTPFFQYFLNIYLEGNQQVSPMYVDLPRQNLSSKTFLGKTEDQKFYCCVNTKQLLDNDINKLTSIFDKLLYFGAISPYSLVTRYNQTLNAEFTLNSEQDMQSELFTSKTKFCYDVNNETITYLMDTNIEQNKDNPHVSLVIDPKQPNIDHTQNIFTEMMNRNYQDRNVFNIKTNIIQFKLVIISKQQIPNLSKFSLQWDCDALQQYFSEYIDDQFKFQLIQNRSNKDVKIFSKQEILLYYPQQRINLIPNQNTGQMLQNTLQVTQSSILDYDKMYLQKKLITQQKTNLYNATQQKIAANPIMKHEYIQNSKQQNLMYDQQILNLEQNNQIACYQLNQPLTQLFDVLQQQQITPTMNQQIWCKEIKMLHDTNIKFDKEKITQLCNSCFGEAKPFMRFHNDHCIISVKNAKNIQNFAQQVGCNYINFFLVSFSFPNETESLKKIIEQFGCFVSSKELHKDTGKVTVHIRTTEAALAFLNRTRNLDMEIPEDIIPQRLFNDKVVQNYVNNVIRQNKIKIELTNKGFIGNQADIQRFLSLIRSKTIKFQLPIKVVPFFSVSLEFITQLTKSDKVARVNYQKRLIICQEDRFEFYKTKIDAELEMMAEDMICLSVCETPSRSQNAIVSVDKCYIYCQHFCAKCYIYQLENEFQENGYRMKLFEKQVGSLGVNFASLCLTDDDLLRNVYSIFSTTFLMAMRLSDTFKECEKCKRVINKNQQNNNFNCQYCNVCWCAKCQKWLVQNHVCGEVDLPPNMKRCPKCRVITEKIDGCNRISCTQCGAHWCFKCGAGPYNTVQDAYAHLQQAHGGYWDNK